MRKKTKVLWEAYKADSNGNDYLYKQTESLKIIKKLTRGENVVIRSRNV